jgi:hypothetical protein
MSREVREPPAVLRLLDMDDIERLVKIVCA